MSHSVWTTVRHERQLAQGDHLPQCLVPSFSPSLGAASGTQEVSVDYADLIIVTQSCDLANNKAQFVALCPIHSLGTFEDANEAFKKKGRWEEVRKGRTEGLHLIASPENPEDNRGALVTDFRMIHSLPLDYLTSHASTLDRRWRLQSPFLEHFSQAFARFYMRVGLPTPIPPFA
jgi:hypothetical protein